MSAKKNNEEVEEVDYGEDEDIKSKTAKSRRWTLTFWKDPNWLLGTDMCERINYFCSCREIAPTTGRVHWQSYCQFKTQVRIKNIQDWWEEKGFKAIISRGDGQQNMRYCFKIRRQDPTPNPIEDRFEFGEMVEQGKRSDLDTIKRELDKTGSVRTIQEENMEVYLRYRNGWKDIVKESQRKRARFEEVQVFAEYAKSRINCNNLIRKWVERGAFFVDQRFNPGLYMDEYNGEDIVVVYRSQAMVCDRFYCPMNTPLPTKYNTTYANYTKWVEIYLEEQKEP